MGLLPLGGRVDVFLRFGDAEPAQCGEGVYGCREKEPDD